MFIEVIAIVFGKGTLPSSKSIAARRAFGLGLLWCAGAAVLGCRSTPQPLAPPSPSLFERLKSLVGRWEARTEKGSIIKVSYRLVSNDSVLVQSFVTPSGRETLTVFHLDGARVMATHYCAQGNQPRLLLDPASTSDHLIFGFFDATNLARSAAAHLVRLDLVFDGTDRYIETESYEEDGKPDVTSYHFVRQR